jgi:hypothetical protein
LIPHQPKLLFISEGYAVVSLTFIYRMAGQFDGNTRKYVAGGSATA